MTKWFRWPSHPGTWAVRGESQWWTCVSSGAAPTMKAPRMCTASATVAAALAAPGGTEKRMKASTPRPPSAKHTRAVRMYVRVMSALA